MTVTALPPSYSLHDPASHPKSDCSTSRVFLLAFLPLYVMLCAHSSWIPSSLLARGGAIPSLDASSPSPSLIVGRAISGLSVPLPSHICLSALTTSFTCASWACDDRCLYQLPSSTFALNSSVLQTLVVLLLHCPSAYLFPALRGGKKFLEDGHNLSSISHNLLYPARPAFDPWQKKPSTLQPHHH